jgi:hypothetical protein
MTLQWNNNENIICDLILLNYTLIENSSVTVSKSTHPQTSNGILYTTDSWQYSCLTHNGLTWFVEYSLALRQALVLEWRTESIRYSVLTTYWTTGFDPWHRKEDVSFSLCAQTDYGVHPASCPVGTGGPFPVLYPNRAEGLHFWNMPRLKNNVFKI